jgi:hypothetical protein
MWQEKNAGKPLVERTKTCPKWKHREYFSYSTTEPPPRPQDPTGRGKVDKDSCFFTGEILEAGKPGYNRVATWCCALEDLPEHRPMTEEEATRFNEMGLCRPIVMTRTGEEHPSDPKWAPKIAYVPTTCHETGVIEGPHQLICCKRREPGPVEFRLAEGPRFVHAELTPEQQAANLAEREARIAEREQILIESAEPEYSFFQRYGALLLFAGGAVAVGLVAGVIKKRSQSEE